MVGYEHLLQNKTKKGQNNDRLSRAYVPDTVLCKHYLIREVSSISPVMKSELRKVKNFIKR